MGLSCLEHPPASFDHLVGSGEEGRRDYEAEPFAALRLMVIRKRVGCSTGRSAGFVPFKIRST